MSDILLGDILLAAILFFVICIWMQGNRFGKVLSLWFDRHIYWKIKGWFRK